jgi:hypothetical protein
MYTPVQLCTADGTILPDTNIPWQTESQKLWALKLNKAYLYVR